MVGFGRIEAMFGFSWQIVILFSGLLAAAANVVGKRQVDRMSAFQVGFARDIGAFVVILIVLTLIGGSVWIGPGLVFIVLYGILLSVSSAAFASATRDSMSSTVVFSYSLSQIGIIFFSFFLFGEWVYFNLSTSRGLVNLAAAIIALVAFWIHRGGKLRTIRWSKMLGFAILGNVMGNLYAKYVLVGGIEPIVFLLWQCVGLTIGDMLFMSLRKKSFRLGKSAYVWGILQGIFVTYGVFLYLNVIKFYPLSLAVILRRVVTVLFATSSGLFLFKESKKIDRRMGMSLLLGLLVFGMVLVANK